MKIEVDQNVYEYYHKDVGDIECRHPLGSRIIVPHPDHERKLKLLNEFSVFGNPGTNADGKHIGDLFNGIFSLISLRKKSNTLNQNIYISAPEFRYEIVNFFKNANCIPVTSDIFVDIHICSLNRKNDLTIYDCFSTLDLESNDMFDDFNFSGNVDNNITEDDIIIFPITSGTNILDYNLFLKIINEQGLGYNNIYWNVEPNLLYRKNYNDQDKTLNLSIMDIMTTIKEKNPIIIGHRSGIFDLIFSMLPDTRSYCVYDTNDQLQLDFRFKYDNPRHYDRFETYIERRKNFVEIFV
jgi:hypothetical protein